MGIWGFYRFGYRCAVGRIVFVRPTEIDRNKIAIYGNDNIVERQENRLFLLFY